MITHLLSAQHREVYVEETMDFFCMGRADAEAKVNVDMMKIVQDMDAAAAKLASFASGLTAEHGEYSFNKTPPSEKQPVGQDRENVAPTHLSLRADS